MNALKKIHWAGVFGAITTLIGLVASPAVAAILPPKVSAGVILAGAVIQSVTRGVHKGDIVELPKEDVSSDLSMRR